MRLPATLASFVLLGASHAAMADTARTVDFTQRVANPTTGQCPQRTAYYFITGNGAGAGMLNMASQWNCSASSGNGSIGVCQLDQTLKCRSDIQFRDKSGNPIDLSGYAVTLKGVTARGEFHPWVDPEGAAPIIKAIGSVAAQQAARNQAALEKLGGEENFRQLLTAGMCRYALVRAGVVQPTAREAAENEHNKKSDLKITVDTTPAHLATCRTTIRTFCARTDLPATLTQMDDYKVLCAAAPK
jgi:hypothetical protein